MTSAQRLFLVQARSAMAVFRLLVGDDGLPRCHALQHLQMATELLGKAHKWKDGAPAASHQALVGFLNALPTNREAQERLGWKGNNAGWRQTLRKLLPLAQRIENLAPDLAGDGPNPEYPWPRDAPTTAPTEHAFSLWDAMRSPEGNRFLHFLQRLLDTADAYL